MAIDPYNSTATTSTSDYYPLDEGTAGGTSTTGDYRYRRVREILVEHPDDWSDEDHEAYVDLVNNQTNTGWKVTMLIKGEVKIYDENIERMPMLEFLPILKQKASKGDIGKIDTFFSEKQK